MKSAQLPGLAMTVLYVSLLTFAGSGIAHVLQLKINQEASSSGCLPGGEGFVRARLRGETDFELNWSNADMQCDGGARPDASGVRVTFMGRVPSVGTLRLVFGITTDPSSPAGRNLPTNVTLILEDQQKLYSTAGDTRCTIDELEQRSGHAVAARGFCTAPATILTGSDELLLERFDFVGVVRDDAAH
jgi:hypothetical protein